MCLWVVWVWRWAGCERFADGRGGNSIVSGDSGVGIDPSLTCGRALTGIARILGLLVVVVVTAQQEAGRGRKRQTESRYRLVLFILLLFCMF